MATTVTLQVPTTENYDLNLKRIPVASLSNFAVTRQIAGDNDQTVVYTYGAGDAADVLKLTAKRVYNPKRDQTNCSLRLEGLTKTSVSETGSVTYDPIDVILAWNLPGQYSKDSDFVVTMMSIAMSIFAQELTGANGTPTSLVVDKYDHNTLLEIV